LASPVPTSYYRLSPDIMQDDYKPSEDFVDNKDEEDFNRELKHIKDVIIQQSSH